MAMSPRPTQPFDRQQVPSPPDRQPRWLLLVQVLPSTASALRARTLRRLVELGAIAVKPSVHVLPDSPAAREDFEWLKAGIEGAGGDATVFAADSVDAWTDDALIDAFRRARQVAYAKLARDLEREHRRGARKGSAGAPPPPVALEAFRQRAAAIEQIDFFGSTGRDHVRALMAAVEGLSDPGPAFRKRRWVTTARPGADRMASAWLIRRFIDPDATFGFVPNARAVTDDVVAFDMFGVEFSHHGDDCAFEVLRERFGIHDEAVGRLAMIVHDLDLKDGRYSVPEAPTIGRIVEGLQLACDKDDVLLGQGITVFEALYQSLARGLRT
jgi:hypothetical protein